MELVKSVLSIESDCRSWHRTPLIAGILQNLVNLGLDILLVVFAGWGVRGAAWAISVAQAMLWQLLQVGCEFMLSPFLSWLGVPSSPLRTDLQQMHL